MRWDDKTILLAYTIIHKERNILSMKCYFGMISSYNVIQLPPKQVKKSAKQAKIYHETKNILHAIQKWKKLTQVSHQY